MQMDDKGFKELEASLALLLRATHVLERVITRPKSGNGVDGGIDTQHAHSGLLCSTLTAV